MKKIFMMTIIGFLLLGLSINVAEAQQGPPQGKSNILENLFTLRALRMTRALDLTEQQAAVIFPELNRAEKDKAELQKELAREIRELRAMLKDEKTPVEQYEARVDRINELRAKLREREEAFEKFLFGQLTPVQKAKYIIFNVDFNANLMMRMRRAAETGQKIK